MRPFYSSRWPRFLKVSRMGLMVFLLADCDLRLGDYKRAIALLDPWEKEMPNDPGRSYLLGTALIRDQQTERGGQVIDRIEEGGREMIRWFLLAGQLAALGAANAQDCKVCHRREAEAATSSPMTHALERAGESDILKNKS